MADGVIRYKAGFTAVQNTVARNDKLPLRAKGLFLVIQAHITIPDRTFKKSDFFYMSCEGEKAFESAWNDLKEAGYLKTHIYTRNGKFENEYELLDEAVPGPHTFYYDKTGKVTRTNLDLVEKRAALAQKQREIWKGTKEESDTEETDGSDRTPEKGGTDRYPQNGTYANGTNGKGTNGNSTYANGGNNNKTITKTENKTDLNILHHQLSSNEGVADDEKITEEAVKKNIEYERLCSEYPGNVLLFDYIVKVMCEMLTTLGPRVYIARNHYEDVNVIREKIGELTYDDIIALIDQLPDKAERKISDPKSFMRTCLFNVRERTDVLCQIQKPKTQGRKQQQYDFDALMKFINA